MLSLKSALLLFAFMLSMSPRSEASSEESTETTLRSFQVFSFKPLTSQVDRLYGQDGNALATLFCHADTAEVMFVDSRVPELDGVVFHFNSASECSAARATLRSSLRKCVTLLQLDKPILSAAIKATRCR